MIELPIPLKKIKDEIRFKVDSIRFRKHYDFYQNIVEEYKNKHSGERLFIIATGPSINNTNLNASEVAQHIKAYFDL